MKQKQDFKRLNKILPTKELQKIKAQKIPKILFILTYKKNYNNIRASIVKWKPKEQETLTPAQSRTKQ